MRDFYADYAEAMAHVRFCKLFSPDDGLIAPYDSGRVDGGVNVELPGMRHMDSVKKRAFYDVMRDACFDGALLGGAAGATSRP